MRQPTNTQRDQNIRTLRYGDNPVPVPRIARIFGISCQRVYAILKKVTK